MAKHVLNKNLHGQRFSKRKCLSGPMLARKRLGPGECGINHQQQLHGEDMWSTSWG